MKAQRVMHRDAGAPWSSVSFDTVVQMAAHGCRTNPEVPAVIFEDGLTMARRQLLEGAQKFAGYLLRHTMPGERIAIMLDNRIECMIAFLAALLAERTLVPFNPGSKRQDAAHLLRDCGCVLLIASRTHEPLIAGLRGELSALRKVLIVEAPEPDGLAPFLSDDDAPRPEDCKAQRNSIATIYYTSGTTGLPKGCILDHQWWLRLCDIHLRSTRASGRYRPLCCVPFYYADSMFQLLCALHLGGTLIAMRRFSVSRFWQVVVHHRVSELYLIASMPVLLLKQDPHPLERQHELQAAICAAVPANLHRQLVDRFGVPFIDSYGSTEAGWNIRVPWQHAEEMIGSGSMGVGLPELQLRIIDEAGREVAVGSPGELLVRGPGLFAGYLNDPDATAHALRGGWYHTGDLVRVDESGWYSFIGRKKDVVRRSGETVAAAEVEQLLRSHPMILDAAVVPSPDEVRGEEVTAHLLVDDAGFFDAANIRELIAYCAERLAPFKIPRYLVLRTTDFPRTPTMRVRKGELAAEQLPPDTWDREIDGRLGAARLMASKAH